MTSFTTFASLIKTATPNRKYPQCILHARVRRLAFTLCFGSGDLIWTSRRGMEIVPTFSRERDSQGALVSGLVGKQYTPVAKELLFPGQKLARLPNSGTSPRSCKKLVGNEAATIKGVLTAGQKETLQDLRTERKELVRDRSAHQIPNLRDLNLTSSRKRASRIFGRSSGQRFRRPAKAPWRNRKKSLGKLSTWKTCGYCGRKTRISE